MSSISDLYDLQTTCRSCLRQKTDLFPLDEYPNDNFVSDLSTENPLTTGELMMACTKVKIASEDGLPPNVCMQCVTDLKAAFAFKTMCEDSDGKLRSALLEHLSRAQVKLERLDEQFDSKIDTDECGFETEWCLTSGSNEALEAVLSPKRYGEEEIELDLTELSSIKALPIAVSELPIAVPVDGNSPRFNSPDAWDELSDNDFKVEENKTLIERIDRAPKQNEQSKNGSKQKTKKEKNFMCEYCSATFHSVGNLNLHYVTHTKRKDFICDICKRQYTTKACLKDHMRYHGDKSKLYCHLCPHCGKGFAYRNVLLGHINTHTGVRPYECDICHKSFHTSQYLRNHKQKHDQKRRYVCKTCGKGFLKNNKLIIHIRSHTGEKPYQCTVCELRFNQNSTLRAHMRVHTGEKAYGCSICDERFIQNYQLVGHRRKTGHYPPGMEPPPKKIRPLKADGRKRARKSKKKMELEPEPNAEVTNQFRMDKGISSQMNEDFQSAHPLLNAHSQYS